MLHEDTTLIALLNGRFGPLRPYFNGIEEDDLRGLDQEELVSFVAPEHKLLMRIFVNKNASLFEPNPFESTYDHGIIIVPTPRPLACVKNGCLDLKRKLLSNRYSEEIVGNEGIPLYNLRDKIVSHVKNHTVNKIDMSSNLLEDDLEMIVETFQALKDIFQNQSIIVDLSKNKFGSQENEFWSSLNNLLSCKFVAYADLTLNDFATRRNKGEFIAHTDGLLNKLIWIPKEWVDTNAWKLLASEENYDVIIKTHHKFYT